MFSDPVICTDRLKSLDFYIRLIDQTHILRVTVAHIFFFYIRHWLLPHFYINVFNYQQWCTMCYGRCFQKGWPGLKSITAFVQIYKRRRFGFDICKLGTKVQWQIAHTQIDFRIHSKWHRVIRDCSTIYQEVTSLLGGIYRYVPQKKPTSKTGGELKRLNGVGISPSGSSPPANDWAILHRIPKLAIASGNEECFPYFLSNEWTIECSSALFEG